MNWGPVLVVPAFEQGQGGGHLIRSQVLVRDLRTQGREAYLHIPGLGTRTIPEVYLDTPLLDEAGVDGKQWGFIVLDRFRTKREEFVRWSRIAPVIGIDEGGACREEFDFLIDLLPGLLSPPNLLAPWMLPLPKNQRGSFLCGGPQAPHAPRRCLKILVSFGAEDPAGLTLPVSLALMASSELTVVLSMLGNIEVKEILMSRGVRVIEGVPELREYMAGYDLVVTHFGLTAFESLYAKVPVLLVSPSTYHEKLAKNAGFVSAGIGRQGAGRLPRLMGAADFLPALGKKCEKIAAQYRLDEAQSLGTLLATYSPLVSPSCPCCGAANHRALARFPDRTYRCCTECGMVYMLRSSPPPIEYARDYFFDFYKKQYGKTYLEDFPGLIQTGKTRVQHIKALLASSAKPRLLDIGCAYGPFLVAAQEEGFAPTGLEAAEDAVRYVQDELAIPCFRGLFPDTPAGAEDFDVISLWYVIEHFEEPHQVLSAIGKLLKPGGVLAFSTPSLSGISGRVSRIRFLDKSPADHWTIWEPRQVRSILARFGFRLKKIIVTGHHPERFPLIGTFLSGKQGPLYRFFLHLSQLFRLGDTFEVYAVKSPGQGLH
ncbi:MAG: methyltransferase domain-containing protein [Treponema sp.]|nr:methyltransferase domain-containing protein [Treponema sp.]